MKKVFFSKFCCLLFAACAFFACDDPNKELGDGDGDADNGDSNSSGKVEMVTFTINQPDEEALFGIVVDSQSAISGLGDGSWSFATVKGSDSLESVKDIPEDPEDYQPQVEAKVGAIYVGMKRIDDGDLNYGYDYIAIQVTEVTETTATLNYIHPFYGEPVETSDLINFETNIIGSNPGDELVVSLSRVMPYRLSVAEHPGWILEVEFEPTKVKFINHYPYEFQAETRYVDALFTIGDLSYPILIEQRPVPFAYADFFSSDNHSGKGNSYTVPVYSNTAWTVTCNEAWCTLQTSSGVGDGSISYELATNADGAYRSATIWFTCEGLDEPQPCVITQRAWFKSGQGTETDPYIISNISELRAVTDAGSDYFLMVDDIDASPFIYEETGGWNPIYLGSGHFDGGNHTLSGIWWNRPDNGQEGSFKAAENAVISNLHIKLDARGITSGDYTGGFVGFMRERITITNCSLTGNIKGGVSTGGIIGGAPYQFINLYDCTVNGNIQGLHQVGGIAGTACGDINGCYFEGTVKATEGSAGGILGSVAGYPGYSHNTDIKECASKGQIESNCSAGGLIGTSNVPAYYVEIQNSFSQCSIKVAGGSEECYAGGLIGSLFGGNYYLHESYFAGTITCEASSPELCFKAGIANRGRGISNSYFDKEVAGVEYSTAEISDGALSTTQMKNQSSYSGWDFSTIWTMNGNNYPSLQRINSRL